MRKVVLLFVSTFAALPLAAQPVFTADDLPQIGYEAEYLSDTSENIIVNVGTTGGPHTWDFSREVQGDTIPFEVLDPAATPAGAFFPNAEFAYHQTGTLADTMSGEMWQYFSTTQNEMQLRGDYLESYHPILDSIKLLHDYNPPRTNTVFPLQMGTNWQDSYHTVDTLDDMGFFVVEAISSSSTRVDAWGTAVVPAGSFDVLRTITYDTTMVIVRIMTTPDTMLSHTINYSWVAADVGPVAYISSLDDEQDPNFNTASSYRVLKGDSVGVVESALARSPLCLEITGNDVYFSVPQPGEVRLDIYDAAGCLRDELFNGTLSAGEHRLALPGDLGRGVYFMRMRHTQGSMSVKFTALD